jgi:sugar lactone lactonase YvrE
MGEPGTVDTRAEGFGLVESPRWHDGRLYFSDWTAGEIRVLGAAGESEVAVQHESLPLCFDFLPDGSMLVVSSSTQRLLRVAAEGGLEPYADLTPLSALGANDIVVDGRGNAYVNSNDAPFGATTPEGEPATGKVCLIPAGGGPVRVVADDLDFPNGMAVSAENRTLVVAESYRCRLTAFDIADDGSLSGPRVFADLGADPPDGITLDASGAAWYADVPHAQCVRVAEGGEVLDRVHLDRGGFACMLGGDDGRTLYAVGARWPGAAGLSEETDWAGAVWSWAAPEPRAGWPGN